MYTLQCTITVTQGVVGDLEVAWLDQDSQILTSQGEITTSIHPVVGGSSRITTYILQFSPLRTSHGGVYTCQATSISQHQTIRETATHTRFVHVQSKYCCDALCKVLLHYCSVLSECVNLD